MATANESEKPSAMDGARDPCLLPAWFLQHLLIGAVAATLSVGLFACVTPGLANLYHPRPFPTFQTAAVLAFGAAAGLVAAGLGWRTARKKNQPLGPRFAWSTCRTLCVALLAGTFLYGMCAPRATASSLRREIQSALPIGSPRADVSAWVRAEGLRRLRPAALPIGEANFPLGPSWIDAVLPSSDAVAASAVGSGVLWVRFSFDANDKLVGVGVEACTQDFPSFSYESDWERRSADE